MLWACTECSTRFPPDLACCPHCGGRTVQEAPGGAIEPGAPVLTIPGPPDDTAEPEAAEVPSVEEVPATAVPKSKTKAPKAQTPPDRAADVPGGALTDAG